MPEAPENEPPWTLHSLNLQSDASLHSCPFCGSRQLGLYEYTYSKLFTVDCKDCGAQGPRHSSPWQAQALWNSRDAEPSKDAQAGDREDRLTQTPPEIDKKA